MGVPAHAYIDSSGKATSQEALACLRRDLLSGDATCDEEHRAIVWQALLLQTASEPFGRKTLDESRLHVERLRKKYLQAKPDEACDPLSETESWRAYYKDQNLRAEIKQDCERIFPEEQWFQGIDSQQSIQDCLFLWSKENPMLSYKQGMHELAGIVIWVVVHDHSTTQGSVMTDAYAIFEKIMLNARHFYTTEPSGTSAIILKSRHVQHEILPIVDKELADTLDRHNIEPQLYCMKWLRLLFSREMLFDDLLVFWDLLFAADPTLEICDQICCAMLMRVRQTLLDQDYNTVLKTLMRYQSSAVFPGSLVQDAVYLRNHCTPQGGLEVIKRYRSGTLVSNKPLELGLKGAPAATYTIGALLEQTDRLGINNYVRGAVEEVRRNVTPIITETRHVLSRTQSRETSHNPTPVSNSSFSSAQRDRELASILSQAVLNLRKGNALPENLDRIDEVKAVLQGRLNLADIMNSSPEIEVSSARPSSAPQTSTVSSSPRHNASPIKIPAIRSRARSPTRLVVPGQQTTDLQHSNDRALAVSPKKSPLKKAADYSFLFEGEKPVVSTFNLSPRLP